MKRSEVWFQLSDAPAPSSDVSDPHCGAGFLMAAEDGWAVAPAGWGSPYEGSRKDRRIVRGQPINGDFRCVVCGTMVPAAAWVSGVQNRNHCPRCLWSRHLDLHTAGDRLAACKDRMRPIGLALKQTRKKYVPDGKLPGDECLAAGELMLAHECQGCGKVSINRIAADDDAETLMEVFYSSLKLCTDRLQAFTASGVRLLREPHTGVVRQRLFGE